MNKPLYAWMDKVEFLFNGKGEPLVGKIEIVDANNILGGNEEVTYDIYVGADKNCLYKHVPESHIRRKLVSEPIIRGVLQYHEKDKVFSVKYSPAGYAAMLDNPVFTEIRLNEREQWMPVSLAPLKDFVDKSVEIRHTVPWLQVCELVHTHQDDNDMIYEVYREDANVVLYDGGWVAWKPENLVLRGAKHHVVSEYYEKKVYRWDVENGVMRLCLGNIPEPKTETVEQAEKYVKRRESPEWDLPDVPAEKKMIVERLRIEEFSELGLKRMISHANDIGRIKNTEILTPVTQYGFEYKKDEEWHKVYYQPGFIVDAMVSEEKK